MKLYKAIVFTIIGIVVLGLIVCGCFWFSNGYTLYKENKRIKQSETKTSPPERPNNIPQNAIWYGGKEGGVWIKIDNSSKPNSFYLEMYNDHTGELEDKGDYFVKDCSNKQFSLNEISKLISAFDGEKVILTEIEQGRNCYLEK